tara:strand:- start:761 stop:991 length:231 start_codon:yes stop_codon:yes gene_type:complete
MNKETFESAYVNGEFSPLEAMKSLGVEASELRERVRELEQANHDIIALATNRIGEQYDEIVKLREIIENLRQERGE